MSSLKLLVAVGGIAVVVCGPLYYHNLSARAEHWERETYAERARDEHNLKMRTAAENTAERVRACWHATEAAHASLVKENARLERQLSGYRPVGYGATDARICLELAEWADERALLSSKDNTVIGRVAKTTHELEACRLRRAALRHLDPKAGPRVSDAALEILGGIAGTAYEEQREAGAKRRLHEAAH